MQRYSETCSISNNISLTTGNTSTTKQPAITAKAVRNCDDELQRRINQLPQIYSRQIIRGNNRIKFHPNISFARRKLKPINSSQKPFRFYSPRPFNYPNNLPVWTILPNVSLSRQTRSNFSEFTTKIIASKIIYMLIQKHESVLFLCCCNLGGK